MTFIIIFNAILGVAIVSAIVGGHLWAILSDRSAQAPVLTLAPIELPELEQAPLLEPAIA